MLPLKHMSTPFAITLYFSTGHNCMDILQVVQSRSRRSIWKRKINTYQTLAHLMIENPKFVHDVEQQTNAHQLWCRRRLYKKTKVRIKATLEIEFMTMAEVANISGNHHLHGWSVARPGTKHATSVIAWHDSSPYKKEIIKELED